MKNSSLQLFALFFAILLPCQSLLSSYRSPNSTHPTPKKKYTKKSPPPASRQPKPTLPINTDKEIKKEKPDTKEVSPEEAQPEPQSKPESEPETEIDTETNTKEIQTAEPAAQPDMLTTIYFSAIPLFLHSLNAGLDSGIAAVSKTLIKQFIDRHQFNQLKNELLIKGASEIKTGTQKEKLEFVNKQLLEDEYVQNLEKKTSLSHIMGETIYTGMLYTTIYMFGKLMTIIAPMGLDTLMPKQYKQ